MVSIFNPEVPQQDARLQSEPVRNNFVALNERTNQLTPAATSPISTSIKISSADKLYFEDSYYVPFLGSEINLGGSSGVRAFSAPGTFKEVIVYYDVINRQGTLRFVESAERSVRVRDTETLINGTWNVDHFDPVQVDPDTGLIGSYLEDKIIICSILVTNNGTTGIRGQIVEISNTDIVDLRPFMQRGGRAKALDNHINTPTLADAHPNALITNSLIAVTGGSSVPTVSTNVTNANVIPLGIGQAALFQFLVGSQVRITTSSVGNINDVDALTTFVTGKIVSVNLSPFDTITLDRNVTVNASALVIHGEVTLDRLGFDVAASLAERTNNTFLKIQTSGDYSIFKLGDSLVDNAAISATAGISWTKISKTGSNLTDIATRNHSDLTGAGTNAHTAIDSHLASTSNPHSVTKSQILTGNLIVNSDIDSGASISWTKISKTGSNLTDIETRNHSALTGAGSKSHADIDLHLENMLNPHGVTKSQISLGNVTNDAQLKIASNLADLNSVSTARTNLGLGTTNSPAFAGLSLTTALTVTNGGTGTTTFTSGRILTGNGTSAIQSTLQYSSSSTADTIVYRDASQNFSAGIISATFNGNLTGASAQVAGTSASTVASATTDVGNATSLSTADRIVKRDANGDAAFRNITVSGGTGGVYGHITSTSNPHGVTASQVGIKCGTGTISGGTATITLANANNYKIVVSYNTAIIPPPLNIVFVSAKTSSNFTVKGDPFDFDWIAIPN